MRESMKAGSLMYPETVGLSSIPMRAWIDGLRALADHVEAFAERVRLSDPPTYARVVPHSVSISYYVNDYGCPLPEIFREAVRVLGACDKDLTGSNYAALQWNMGPHTFRLITDKSSVCVKRVVGTRTVKRAKPSTEMIEVEEEIVEWDCGSMLEGT